MSDLLTTLNQYAGLINFALFATIVALLFRMTAISRTALQDKHAAEIAALQTEVASARRENSLLHDRLQSRDEQYGSQIETLKHQLAYFQRISDLPEDTKIEAIKHEYEAQIKQLRERLAALAEGNAEKERTREALETLQSDKEALLRLDTKTVDMLLDFAPKILNFVRFIT